MLVKFKLKLFSDKLYSTSNSSTPPLKNVKYLSIFSLAKSNSSKTKSLNVAFVSNNDMLSNFKHSVLNILFKNLLIIDSIK